MLRQSRPRPARRALLVLALALGLLVPTAVPATATPVCTDGYEGGPPLALCGNRIFPEAELARGYVQYTPDPVTGFAEYRHGLEYLAKKYPRWVSVFTLRDVYGTDEAVTAAFDGFRADDEDDTGDGFDVLVVKLTDHEVPDEGKETLLFSLSVHGNERGGLEGGVRTAEDLAMAAENGGTIVDGIDNYESTTGREPAFNEYEVADVLAQEAVYLVDFNIDGWVQGDTFVDNEHRGLYARGNGFGTDLNRQMPTVGRIDHSRNPLEETEMYWGTRFMQDVAADGIGGLMAYGADIHGELNSNAFMDIMYPAGQFDSVDHRRLMAIAERTKSVIDATLFEGVIDLVEELTGGNSSSPPNVVPTKPAHWATVYDTLGYTDTGFIGDYMATDLGVTGMDYEIFLNHTVPERVWTVVLQENHINATRGIIKTAMAYALTQSQEFSDDNVTVDTLGWPGYVVDPDTVTDTDENGPGRLPGPDADGIGDNGEPVAQASYDVTNQQWFLDTNRLMPQPFRGLKAADVAADPAALDVVDTLVLADVAAPADPDGRAYDEAAYYGNIRSWVERGGNLVLTDRAVHSLGALDVVDASAVTDVQPYMPLLDEIADFEHPLVEGLRPNASQLVESPPLGYEIPAGPSGTNAVMSVVDGTAWTEAGGHTVATTDGGVAVGELALGDGIVRIIGGALPMPTEDNDHRYGLRNYAMTYTALYLMENAIQWDADGLGSPMSPDEVVAVQAESVALEAAADRTTSPTGVAPDGVLRTAAARPAPPVDGGTPGALALVLLAAAGLAVRRQRAAG